MLFVTSILSSRTLYNPLSHTTVVRSCKSIGDNSPPSVVGNGLVLLGTSFLSCPQQPAVARLLRVDGR